eukprot:gene9195-biopygen8568
MGTCRGIYRYIKAPGLSRGIAASLWAMKRNSWVWESMSDFLFQHCYCSRRLDLTACSSADLRTGLHTTLIPEVMLGAVSDASVRRTASPSPGSGHHVVCPEVTCVASTPPLGASVIRKSKVRVLL